MVLEVVRAAIVAYGTPRDASPTTAAGGLQHVDRCRQEGGKIEQIVAKPQRPQTLGKVERFWGTLWRECIETSVFVD